MSPTSIDQSCVPRGSKAVLNGHVHTAGECCQDYPCKWCGHAQHVQTIPNPSGVIYDIVDACESCDQGEWERPETIDE